MFLEEKYIFSQHKYINQRKKYVFFQGKYINGEGKYVFRERFMYFFEGNT